MIKDIEESLVLKWENVRFKNILMNVNAYRYYIVQIGFAEDSFVFLILDSKDHNDGEHP